MPLDNNARELVKRGDALFSKKANYDQFNQLVAEIFFPARADFTSELCLGEDYASKNYESSPILMHRDLGNYFSSFLRPRGQEWFSHDVDDDDLRKEAGVKEYLARNTTTHRRALYAATSGFVESTKEADHDFAAFGNAVLSCEEDPERGGLLFQCHHLKDCAWTWDWRRRLHSMHRNMMMPAHQMKNRWGEGKMHKDVQKACEKHETADKEFKVRHIMMPVADYQYETRKRAPKGAKFVSIYIDCTNQHLISEAPSYEFRYIVPRWQTISGFQYAVSPAAIVAVPDARMINALARIIMEAGEKTVDPPIKAKNEAVVGGIHLYASGITWIDRQYDEKQGMAIEPLLPGNRQVGLGVDLLERTRLILQEAWYLNKLTLPQRQEKTAYETAQLIEEYVRANIPLFEPLETTYNSALLQESFDILMRVGAFGPVDEIPDALAGQDFTFTFSNPLQDAMKKAKVYQFETAFNIVNMAMAIDQAARFDLNTRDAARDAIDGTGAPATWLTDKDEADEAAEESAQKAQMAEMAAGVGAAGQAAGEVGKAVESFAKAGEARRAA